MTTTTTATITPTSKPVFDISTDLVELARSYVEKSRAPSTLRAYAGAWKIFSTWCRDAGLLSLPAEAATVALYAAWLVQTRKVATVEKHLAAIAQVHRAGGLDSPTTEEPVRLVMKGIRRVHGTASKGKAPVTVKTLRAMVAVLPDRLIGIRDQVVLVLGLASGLRRSELVALDIADIRFVDEGLVLAIRRSKTDPEGRGRNVAVPFGSRIETCPVRSVQMWLTVSGIVEGPVLRPIDRHGNLGTTRLSAKAVNSVVKRAATQVGIDAADLGAHSLRVGLVTEAARAGVPERDIARTTGHRSIQVLRGYVRSATIFEGVAAAEIGL